MRALALALAAAVTLAACSPARHAPQLRASDYPGTLRAPASLATDVLWRQRLVARFGDREERFEAVLQKQGDELTLIGLTPFGAKAFVLQQTGEAFTYMPHIDRELPFPPRFILLDVHRTWLPWRPAPDPPPADGEHRYEVDGEAVTEVWQAGRLVERRFERLDGKPLGTITVRFDRFDADGTTPRRAVLDNGWFGYVLEATTIDARTL